MAEGVGSGGAGEKWPLQLSSSSQLEHHDPGAGENKWPKACWAPWVRTRSVVQTQPYVGVLLVKVLKPWQWGPKGLFVCFFLLDVG